LATPNDTPDIRRDLRDADSLCQSMERSVTALTRAIKARMSTKDSKCDADVCQLLDLITNEIWVVANDVNCAAERHGCNYTEARHG